MAIGQGQRSQWRNVGRSDGTTSSGDVSSAACGGEQLPRQTRAWDAAAAEAEAEAEAEAAPALDTPWLIISAETSDYEGDCTVMTDVRTDGQKAAGSDNDCDDETGNKTRRENLQDEQPGRLLLATPGGEGMVNFSSRIYVASLFRRRRRRFTTRRGGRYETMLLLSNLQWLRLIICHRIWDEWFDNCNMTLVIVYEWHGSANSFACEWWNRKFSRESRLPINGTAAVFQC